jgi:pimeloyl-ACP methyl ester carboxylesterase
LHRGYAVLSYDRAGVGLSDPLPKSCSKGYATAADVVADMKALMDMHLPVGGRRKWILVGPSMGSIVAQAYMTLHPDDVTGRDSAHDDENVSTLE